MGGISNLTPDSCKVVLPKTINRQYVRDHQVWEEGISSSSFWLYYMKRFKEVFQQSNQHSVEALLQCPERKIMRRSWHFVISIVAHVVIICHTFCVC